MKGPIDTVAIGASAGAVEALSVILPGLPDHLPLAIVIVIHVPAHRDTALAQVFESKCRLRVKEAEDTEPLENGTIYFAPSDYHVLIEPSRRLSLSTEGPVLYSRPSIDVLFESAADSLGDRVLGVILSGANSDGANGLLAIQEAGGIALVQDPETAFATAMPRAAIASCPTARVADLQEITWILSSVGERESV